MELGLSNGEFVSDLISLAFELIGFKSLGGFIRNCGDVLSYGPWGCEERHHHLIFTVIVTFSVTVVLRSKWLKEESFETLEMMH